MARGVIELVPIKEIPQKYLETASMMSRLVGDSTTIQVLAHSLPATDFYFEDFYKQMFYNGRPGLKMDVRSKQLVRLRISKRHGCALCNRANEEEIRTYGFREEQIDDMFNETPNPAIFSEAELALIDFTDQMILVNPDGLLTRSLYDRLLRHFSREQIVEIGMVAAVLVGAAKLTFVLDVVPREATCGMIAPAALEAAE